MKDRTIDHFIVLIFYIEFLNLLILQSYLLVYLIYLSILCLFYLIYLYNL